MRYISVLSLALLLGACANNTESIQSYMRGKKIEMPKAHTMDFCHGYGCKFIKTLSFNHDEWRRISQIFTPPAATPAQEREKIAAATALFENINGAKTGTQNDRAGTFRKIGDDQLDCVDESTNTTSALLLLEQNGLLKFHRVKPPTVRIPILHAGRWPHQAAVIEEKESAKLFIVDSWFRDNAQPADIIDLKSWKEGWKPKNMDDSWL